jgi:hypothetical protein
MAMNSKKIIFGIILALMIVHTVSAGFTCGEVLDSDYGDSASWVVVNIYSNNSKNFAQCQISPAGNKYCCDPEAIPGSSWKVGNVYYSEVYDNLTGYSSGPVSLIVSGQGYDIFPQMKLDKAVKISNPRQRVIFSNNTSLLLNATFLPPYNFVEIVNKDNKSVLCTNCTSYSQDYIFDFGMNKLTINAINNERRFSQDLNFAILESYNFTRDFYCDKCGNSKIRSDKNVSVNLKVNLSDEIEGFELKEYIPADWKIIDSNNGRVSYYDENYNVISWNISGKDIEINYLLKSPKIRLFPLNYEFASELENILLNKSIVKVYRLFPFFSDNRFFNLKQLTQVSYSRIHPENPIVLSPKNIPIKKVAIFPKNIFYNAKAAVYSYTPKNKIKNAVGYYLIDTNLNSQNISKVYLEISYNKREINNSLGNISFYSYDNEEWEKVNLSRIRETKEEIVYGGFIYHPINRLAVVLKKNLSFFHFLGFFG